VPVKRAFKPRYRSPGNRDAKLIVVATEDTKAAPKYFREFKQASRNTKIYVEDRLNTSSSPDYVVNQLDQFTEQYELEEGDELWAVIDVDSWGNAKLSKIAKQCSQKKYHLAVSNPCFELWLLLHLKSMDEYDDATKQDFLQKKKSRARASRNRLEKELAELLKG
jgi:RloB-like protein